MAWLGLGWLGLGSCRARVLWWLGLAAWGRTRTVHSKSGGFVVGERVQGRSWVWGVVLHFVIFLSVTVYCNYEGRQV